MLNSNMQEKESAIRNPIQEKNLMVFLPFQISLKKYKDIGLLSREIKPFLKYSEYFSRVDLISYSSDTEFETSLVRSFAPQSIKILSNQWGLPVRIYYFLIPILFHKRLRSSNLYLIDQMSGSFPALIASFLYKKKMVVRCGYELLYFLEMQSTSKLKRLFVWFLEKIIYKLAFYIILTSIAAREFVWNRFDSRKHLPIQVLRNWIDVETFKPLATKKRTLQHVLYVGRLEPQKNLFSLIEAIGYLNLKLTMIGKGPLKDTLTAFALLKRADVHFVPTIQNQDLPALLNEFRIFILPSHYEGCPKALLEAMACGLTVIGTNVIGTQELITHKKNGYLCDPNVSSIIEALIEVINDEELHKTLSHNAVQYVRDYHSFNAYIQTMVHILQSA